jgi:methionine-rich copper-binding protein CopC
MSRPTNISPSKRKTGRSILLGLCLAGLYGPAVLAQPAEHARYQASSWGSSLVQRTLTTPNDDAVLPQAPREILLQFPEQVRLVKLTLHDDTHEWVDIDFRYDPRPGNRFVWALPGLAQTAYYTAAWAILGANDELVRGSFSFAFGPDAEPPSLIRPVLDNPGQPGPDGSIIRQVAPPPTQIILDQDNRSFDPPFTIRLDQEPD